jgi:hypothetical protein
MPEHGFGQVFHFKNTVQKKKSFLELIYSEDRSFVLYKFHK